MRDWYPNLGDYVWWAKPCSPGRTPAQVIGEALASNDDWIIRTLTGDQKEIPIRSYTIQPMTEMEVIAICTAWGDSVIL